MWPTRRRAACAHSSSDYATSSGCTTKNVLTRRSTMRRLPSVTGLQHVSSTGSCVSRNMATRMCGASVSTGRSSSTASSSTSMQPWPASQSVWLNLRVAGPSATVRSCSVPSPTEAMNYENQSARAVDLGTTLRVAPRVHSPSKNRPERNENCVTHVVGLKCYLCRRLLTEFADELIHGSEHISPHHRVHDLLRRHQRREIGVGAGHDREDRGVDDAKTLQTLDAALGVDNRHWVLGPAHAAGTGSVPVADRRFAHEGFQRLVVVHHLVERKALDHEI